MSLENIYYIGQTVAVIVIMLTLFALLYQGYQTNKIARADLTLNVWWQTGLAHATLVDTPEKADFMHRALYGDEALTESEKIRFGNLLGLAIGTHEAAFNLRMRGLVEPTAYARIEGISRHYLHSRRVRKWWRIRREYRYDPRFRAIIDAMAEELESAQSGAPQPQEPSA